MNTNACIIITIIIIIIVEIHRHYENELMQCSNLVEWETLQTIYKYIWIDGCVCISVTVLLWLYLCMNTRLQKRRFLQYAFIFSVFARITKQTSAFKCMRPKCTLHFALKRSSLKLIFIQIGIKTCSGNYDSYNSKCKCAMNRLWRFAHAFHSTELHVYALALVDPDVWLTMYVYEFV